mmetsp:Transcript_23691/g.32341  ORF Transcript_23691/g.32341 Transcript_23691/m.32341 type:complete len:268 (-) Transcript_23691:34-837(-)|eukprot:CAMPEP_0201478792 /NCGR_PEP_ID=MMETSP0151_2-20130828/3563_1 /ASSEMBLY_ACC=CAM_ASM_000257 /TAXON_ID=200890 /ORGANISM="Paramoeba atlantica, Strain 621/1 / CCAP 1560/9" /LENGTH=267 /DNA_ID=CAMNT_0047859993 /DNA_START=84 /DNA_END=887 /DNA_ORIENTATION=-
MDSSFDVIVVENEFEDDLGDVSRKRKRRKNDSLLWDDETPPPQKTSPSKSTSKPTQLASLSSTTTTPKSTNSQQQSKTTPKTSTKPKPTKKVFGKLNELFPSDCFRDEPTRQFEAKKSQIALYLFNEYNKRIFRGKLPPSLKLEWSGRLTATAGQYWDSPWKKIQLSSIVLDRYSRLQSTLCHEMCHAAVDLIDRASSSSHGHQWQAWTRRAMVVDSTLVITTTHGYELLYRYNYKCLGCGEKFGRHRKVDLSRFGCPYCESSLKPV